MSTYLSLIGTRAIILSVHNFKPDHVPRKFSLYTLERLNKGT